MIYTPVSAVAQGKDLYSRLEHYCFSKLIERGQILAPISNDASSALQRCFPNRRGPFPVVPCGIETEIFSLPEGAASKEIFPRRLALTTPYFLHVGVLLDRKNPAGLIQAMGRVIRTGHNQVSLVCVGPYSSFPAVRDQVLQLAHKEGIGSAVQILGEVSENDLAWLYRNSLGLIFPSFVECFGIPAAECLASGTPCVVSRAGALPDVAGDYGILVDPHNSVEIADGMLRLLDDAS